MIAHTKSKLQGRLDLLTSNLEVYSGKGNHLIKFLRMKKNDYTEYINMLSFFESNALEFFLDQHHIDYPFLR
jgi:hypothetical protein